MFPNVRPPKTYLRGPPREYPDQPRPERVIIHRSPATPYYPGVPHPLDIQARSEPTTNATASHAPASTLAPLSSMPGVMSPHSSGSHHGPRLIPNHLPPGSDRNRSSPPAGQDTEVTHIPKSGVNGSSHPAGQDTDVARTPTSAGIDRPSLAKALDGLVSTDAEPYGRYHPRIAQDHSMSQHTPAGDKPNYHTRPAHSENPPSYASNNDLQYPHNATQAVSENRTLHDTNRAHQDVPDDRMPRRTSYTHQDAPDNRSPHHRNPQGHYPSIDSSSSYSAAQRWDSSTRPPAYQEPYRHYSNNGPQYSGQYQEPAQDGRSMPAGYDVPPHHPYHDGRGYSHQQPSLPLRHHSYHDSRGYPQQQPSPVTRHHSYHDERGYSQQQPPPPSPHHPYHDSSGYPQQPPPPPSHHPYHDERGYLQQQPPPPPHHAYHDGRGYLQQPPHPPHLAYHDGRGYPQDQPPAAQPPPRQSAPRQRTAIACKYCRRRKIRCSGFTADGSGGQCTNCARFKQECVFTPVSSAQAFVPLIALTEALQTGRNLTQGVFGAHGQRLPSDSVSQNSTEPYQGYHPHQATSGPQMAHNQHMQQPIHQAYLPPLNRSPHDRDTLPSPTGSLDSQKRKREADERHFARAAPSAPGQFSEYSRESNVPYRIPGLHDEYQYHSSVPSPPTRQYGYREGENVTARLPALQDGQQYRSSVPSPPSSQQYGHQQGENALAYRPMEDGRQSTQWASVNSNEAPRNLPSPNGSSSSFHSQNPTGNHQPSQLSPYRAEPSQFPLASPARTNSGGGNHDQVARETERPNQMNIANIVERDNKDVDRDMLKRLSGNRS